MQINDAPGFHATGIGYNSAEFQSFRDLANESITELQKAMTTGNWIVTPGPNGVGGAALRQQFLHGVLEKVSYEQDDAKMMKRIKKRQIYEPTFEWTIFNQYGGPGDGFVAETGSDGNFGLNGSDDNFTRLLAQVKYLGAQRVVSLSAQTARNIEDAMKVADTGASLELIGKANIAMYWGNSLTHTNQFDGFDAQLRSWATSYPSDQDILFDCGGEPVGEDIIQEVSKICRQKYGAPQLLMQSAQGFADTQRLLYPKERTQLGTTNGTMGVIANKFASAFGNVEMDFDIMLRPNRPLVADGPGISGLPRTTLTADVNSIAFSASPFTTCAIAAAGTGNFWVTGNVNTDSSAAAAPALPNGPGNQASRLPIGGNYYYAVAPVYNGFEGAAWVYGASTIGTVTGASFVTPTAASPIVTIAINTSSIPSYGSTYALNSTKFRVYRCDNSAPTSMASFNLVGEFGCPSSGAPTFYDNGFTIPGSDTAFLFTMQKNGGDGMVFAQLLPLLRRPLPNLPLGNPIALLLFGMPVMLVRRHHIMLRNIGRYSV